MAEPAAPATTPNPAEPAPATPPSLDTLPLSDYIAQREPKPEPGPAPVPPTPAPAPAPAPVPAPDDDDGAAPPSPEEQTPLAKANRTRGRLQERLDALTRERGDALSLYHGTLAKLEAANAELARARSPQPAAPGSEEPTLDSFLSAGKTYEHWLDARIEWRARQIADATAQQTLQAERVRAEQAAQARVFHEAQASFPQRVEAAKQKFPDYDDVVANNESVRLSPVMQDIALRSPQGAEIMYWLGTHPQEANEIGAMTASYPPQAYPLVERYLTSQLAGAGAPRTGAQAVVPSSSAPAPITPVGGGSTQSTSPLDEAPLGDYIRRRTAEISRRRGTR